MGKKCVLVSALLLLCMAGSLSAQDNAVDLSRFRALLTNGDRVEGRDGALTATGLEGTSLKGDPISLAKSDIRLLDRYAGNNGGKGTSIGAGVGFAISLLALMAASAEAGSDPYKEVDEGKIVPVFAVTTGLGAVIGYAIGRSQKKWEKVPLGTNWGIDFRSGEAQLVFTLSL